MTLRFVGVSSSHRKGLTTETLVNYALECAKAKALEILPSAQVELQFVSLSGKEIKHCIDCLGCLRKNTDCILKDDRLEAVSPLIHPSPPDGVIFGAPVYFHSTNAQMRSYMERFTSLFKHAWHKHYHMPVS